MDSNILEAHLPCTDCGSSDALASYDDGHTFCHSCQVYTPDGKPAQPPVKGLAQGECLALEGRLITLATCEKWRYEIGEHNGKPCHIANYKDDKGRIKRQGVRFR